MFPLFATGVVYTSGNLPPVSVTPVANLPPVSLTRVANLPPVSTTLAKPVEKFMQIYTGAEHFGNVTFWYSELLSQYHIEASIDVNRPRQDCDITCML